MFKVLFEYLSHNSVSGPLDSESDILELSLAQPSIIIKKEGTKERKNSKKKLEGQIAFGLFVHFFFEGVVGCCKGVVYLTSPGAQLILAYS